MPADIENKVNFIVLTNSLFFTEQPLYILIDIEFLKVINLLPVSDVFNTQSKF